MSLQLIKEILAKIIEAIENSAIASVRSLSKTITTHTYRVEVKDPIKKVEVEGSVKVSNHPNIDPQIKKLVNAIDGLKKPLAPYKGVKVENFPKFPAFPQFPKEFKISNPQSKVEVSNLNVLSIAIQKVVNTLEKLKLDPTIKVEAPIVNVPPPTVTVEKTPSPIVNVQAPDMSEFKKMMKFLEGLDAKNPLAVRLSDGAKFYKAIDKLAEAYTSNNSSPFQDVNNFDARPIVNSNGELQVTVDDTWGLNDTEEITDTKYLGKENVLGKYQIVRIITTGNSKALRFATIRNNPTIGDYTEAWNGRVSLNYGLVSETF